MIVSLRRGLTIKLVIPTKTYSPCEKSHKLFELRLFGVLVPLVDRLLDDADGGHDSEEHAESDEGSRYRNSEVPSERRVFRVASVGDVRSLEHWTNPFVGVRSHYEACDSCERTSLDINFITFVTRLFRPSLKPCSYAFLNVLLLDSIPAAKIFEISFS